MTDIEIKTIDPETVAFIEMRGAYNQVPDAMGRLYGWAAQHSLQPAGMPMAVYLTEPDAGPESEAEWELMTPVAGAPAESLADEDGCGIRHIEPQLVASTMHVGPYELIEQTYRDLGNWIARNGYDVAGPPSEVYYSDPATTKPEEYRTEIRFPVAKR